MKIQFYLRFFTKYGQSLFITGNCAQLGDNDLASAIPMQYLTDEFWTANIELVKDFAKELTYNYLLKTEKGERTQYNLERLKTTTPQQREILQSWLEK